MEEAEAEIEAQVNPGDLQETDTQCSTMEWRVTTCLLTENLLQSRKPWTSSEKQKWSSAMQKEMEEHEVWNLVEIPTEKKAVGCKWVFKIKTDSEGKIKRFKARLVAQGFNYDETFSPVVRQESLRMLVALSVQHNLELHHVDVTTAFLNGVLEEEVYMQQPKGFVKPG